MPKTKTVTVKQDEENPIPVEIIAQSIINIDEAFQKLKNSRLTDKALLLLIHDNCGYAPGYPQKKPTKAEIKLILESIGSLKTTYIKDLPKKK